MEIKTCTRIDFLRFLEVDVALKILACLHDPADLIRAPVVSQSWQKFMISHGIWKEICLRKFPQLAGITHTSKQAKAICDHSDIILRHTTLEREHMTYAALFHALTTFPVKSCILNPVSASSTNYLSTQSIINNLLLKDTTQTRYNEFLYWSSKGELDPQVPENLIYALMVKLCLITEIHIMPYQARAESLIFSTRFVRFRMGHPKSFSDIDLDFVKSQENADDKFVWTYTSQTFPMVKESRLQKFKLPEPALCIGGYLQIEFLGQVQKCYDKKYYIRVEHSRVIGRQLPPAFRFEAGLFLDNAY